jgi:hypothetical protein
MPASPWCGPCPAINPLYQRQRWRKVTIWKRVSKKSWWRPEERFAALLEIQLKGCDEIAQRGCPYGSLAQELEKRDGRLGSRAALLVELQREWMERQSSRPWD